MITSIARPLWMLCGCLVIALPGGRTARAQEPVWSLRAGGSVLAPSARAVALDRFTRADFGGFSPTVDLSLERQVDASLALFGEVTLPFIPIRLSSVSSSSPAGTLSPVLFRLGATYQLHPPARTTMRVRTLAYVSAFVVASTHDRSAVTVVDSGTAASRLAWLDLPAAAGGGVGLGIRQRLSEQFAADLAVRYQYLRPTVGQRYRFAFNPVQLGLGLVARLF